MKKKIILVLALLINTGYLSFAKCGWDISIRVYNDGVIVNQFNRNSSSPFYATMATSDSVGIYAYGSYSCWDIFLFIHNSDTIFNAGLWNQSFSQTFYDTGHYYFKYQNSDMITFFMIYDLYVSASVQTGFEEPFRSVPLSVFPVDASGMFSIKSADKIKQIIISDIAGRVYPIDSYSNVSQIDLSRFSSGIYFYCIIDEQEKVWRGKVFNN
ncbi:MAG: T9SS type A sorting domain-containing protein [Bacteroidota bacterium]